MSREQAAARFREMMGASEPPVPKRPRVSHEGSSTEGSTEGDVSKNPPSNPDANGGDGISKATCAKTAGTISRLTTSKVPAPQLSAPNTLRRVWWW